jgi:ABC-2 type transport system ATP-binding protein
MADKISDSAIRTEGLGMVYNPGLFARSKVGLQDLNLDVPRNSIFGYLGHNGAGKTTTIKILVGLQFQTSGEAWVMGGDIRESKTRRNIGFMPENPYFYEYLTAAEALDFYGQLSGMPRAERLRRTDELLDQFGLKHAKHVPMREFSKGMRQRLGLAQAVMHKPPLVILDEPMSGLDPLGRRDVRNIILALRDAGQTVFFSTHILSDVEEICDRVCVLNMSRKVADGPISSLLTGRVLEVQISAVGLKKEDAPDVSAYCTRSWHDGVQFHALAKSVEDADRVKAAIEKAGGTLRAMIPHKESLEEYFVRITQNDKPGGGDAMNFPARAASGATTAAEARS